MISRSMKAQRAGSTHGCVESGTLEKQLVRGHQMFRCSVCKRVFVKVQVRPYGSHGYKYDDVWEYEEVLMA